MALSLLLPPEVWRKILRYATVLPYAFSIEPIKYFSPQRCDYWKRLWPLMRIRRTMVLVSKTWRALANEFLHELFFLRDIRELAILARSLKRNTAQDSEQGCPGPGWFTRRIELHFTLPGGWTSQPLMDIHTILACCPNIQFFIDNSLTECGYMPFVPSQTYTTSLFLSSSSSFRRLDWRWPSAPPDIQALCIGLRGTPELQSLRIFLQDADIPESDSSSDLFVVSLPKLHTLEVASSPRCRQILRCTSFWDLPSLSGVRLSLEPGDTPSIVIFFDFHGHKITSLDVDGDLDVGFILNACPNLHDLAFHLWAEAPPPSVIHSRLRNVGIRGADSLPGDYIEQDFDTFQHLDAHFMVLTSHEHFPVMAVTRLLSAQYSTSLESEGLEGELIKRGLDTNLWVMTWKRWCERFQRRGILLEDGRGTPMFINTQIISW